MKNVINEYAGSVVAVIGTVCLLLTIEEVFMGRDGIIARLITLVLRGL